MPETSYFIFSLYDSLFALESKIVKETFHLPEITTIEEAPPSIVGVMNLRNKIIPVMDLNIRFGHPYKTYSPQNGVVTIEIKGFLMGIIVSDVYNVINIPSEDIEPTPFNGLEGTTQPRFISGQAKAENDIIMILNHNAIIDFGISILSNTDLKSKESNYFCPEASDEEKKVFHKRSQELMKLLYDETSSNLSPMAVIGLNNEYFGFDLDFVREFFVIKELTKVPCCPSHIVGNMNLRGSILTIVDIRGLLNIPINTNALLNKVVITSTGDDILGIAVEEVFDVFYIKPSDITHVPVAVQTLSEKFIKGNSPYGSKMMTVLDLKKILSDESIIINEEV
ncbi:MAG: chemotaxis protein CheW [Desulfobacterales bacterium]|nr:chemotaxis protein CheW [Desulfobacterales bacterium]